MASSSRQSRREQLERQRASWMQEHKQTVHAASRPTTPSSQQKQIPPPSMTNPGKSRERSTELNSDYECQICSTLMAGTDHAPTVLFPCGHTFCKSCLDRLTKPKCPFCRLTIQSRAVNVPLQSMIEKHLKRSGEAEPEDAAEKYLSEYRALSMRQRALLEDRKHLRKNLAETLADAQRMSVTATRLESEHSRATKEFERLRNQIEQLEGQRQENEEARRRVDQERQHYERLLQDIDGQLRPIRIGIDKSRLLFYNFRPDAALSSDDDGDEQ